MAFSYKKTSVNRRGKIIPNIEAFRIVSINNEEKDIRDKNKKKSKNLGKLVYTTELRSRAKNPDNFKDIIVGLDSNEASSSNSKDNKVLEQVIDPSVERYTWLITGPSGAGKSTAASNIMKEYKRVHKKNLIFVVSPKTEDPVLDKHKVLRLKIDAETFAPDQKLLDLDNITNSLWCFDDIEGIRDAGVKRAVEAFRDSLLLVGRSKRISVISINHILLGGIRTLNCVTESQFITFFPSTGINKHLIKYLQDYVGVSNDQIKRICELPSRSVTMALLKPFPRFVLSEDEAFII